MIRVALLLFVINLLSFSVFAENISISHPSPYVRMHANDAVKWQIWDKSILERAKKENKLIFISTGYYACHWCHVMRKESFTDTVVANILNNDFIAVKIDRELNPVLDKSLMNFLELTQGYGGWPLNVFITPDGYPLTGLVYLPKDKFIEVIKNLNSKWLNETKKLEILALNIFKHMSEASSQSMDISIEELHKVFILRVNSLSDELEGGFGNRSKFPMPYLMISLISTYEQSKDEALGEFIVLTLNQMVEQGLHDAIGGGFFRYTIDQGWQIPHFEKMLHTNAAMIKLYVKAYEVFKNKKWLFVAEETMDFVINEMKREKGGYVSSLNAQDVHGEEGGNYVWEKRSINDILGENQDDWIDKNIRFSELPEAQKVLPLGFWWGTDKQAIKSLLLKKRNLNPPVKDDKMIVSWNAYLLSAMFDLSKFSEKPRYTNAAKKLYAELNRQVVLGLVRNRDTNPQKYLQDYVFVSYALWQWRESYSSNSSDLRKLLNETVELFFSENGWSETDSLLIPLVVQSKNIKDGDLPSAGVVFYEMFKNSGLIKEGFKKKLSRYYFDSKIAKRVLDNPLEYSSLIQSRYSGR